MKMKNYPRYLDILQKALLTILVVLDLNVDRQFLLLPHILFPIVIYMID